jgi:hypothetical protein
VAFGFRHQALLLGHGERFNPLALDLGLLLVGFIWCRATTSGVENSIIHSSGLKVSGIGAIILIRSGGVYIF